MENNQTSNKRRGGNVINRYRSDSDPPPKKKRMNDCTVPPRSNCSALPSIIFKAEPEVLQSSFENAPATVNEVPMAAAISPPILPTMSEVIDLSVEVVHKTMKLHTPDFPRFASGDVYIELSPMHLKYSYRLHSVVLSRASSWFKEAMQHMVSEPDEMLADRARFAARISARFELNINPETNTGILFRVPFTMVSVPEASNKGPGPPSSLTSVSSLTRSSKLLSPPSSVNPELHQLEECITTASTEITGAEVYPGLKVEAEEKSTIKREENKGKIAKETGENETETAKKEPNAVNQQRQQELLEAYNNLFLTYYSKNPNIDQNDIQKALRQSELLLNIAEFYGSVTIVRPHLSNCMMNFGREVYKAVLQDPPRWLFLSLFLESAPIFKEAIIHIVGSYPHWQSDTVNETDFPLEIRGFIQRKVADLQSLKTGIDKQLFMSSIRVEGEEVKLDKSDKSTYNTWIIIQFWRDWFYRSLAMANTARKSSIDGNMYRLMVKGGDAYLTLASVRTLIKVLRNKDISGLDGQEIEEDLRLMKEFAQVKVRPLCVNHSMLSVEEEGIAYFTCVKVENDELPWVKKADARE